MPRSGLARHPAPEVHARALPRCIRITRFPITTPCWHRAVCRCVASTRAGMGVTRAAAQRDSRSYSWRDNRLEWLYGKSMAFTDVVAASAKPHCELPNVWTYRKETRCHSRHPRGQVPSRICRGAKKAGSHCFGVAPDARLAGFVRHSPGRDHATMIRAFNGCRALPDTVLVLIGDGPLKLELKELAAAENRSRVLFLGDRSDIPELLPGLDLFVMSSVTEGYSIALLACASGLPIVATKVGGNAESSGGVSNISCPRTRTGRNGERHHCVNSPR